MKSLNIPVWILICFIFISNFALSSEICKTDNASSELNDIINFDEKTVYNEFSDIDLFVSQLSNRSINSYEIPASILSDQVQVSLNQQQTDINYKTSLGLPSIIWGCAFGVPGVMFIYAATNRDVKQTNNAFAGCFFNTVALVFIFISTENNINYF
ncbi:hypothetical protein ACE01N_08210 [Saccharicrinis sp. FJH2]|uniref:hypothetical protein n=1 Tax=Saccharicrinis sp. FJH65 TaxID=3344659 RepID=UPI0035F35214